MKRISSRRAKATQISRETAERVMGRDGYSCLFCRLGYDFEEYGNRSDLAFCTYDIAHFIPRSKGGLGIEENLVMLCRYHHHELDQGKKGLRDEMLGMMEEYLKGLYPDWSKEGLIYDKYAD